MLVNVEVALSLFRRLRGLIGRSDFVGTLLLMPCNDVHTFGMRRAIDIAFVDADGIVIGTHSNVGPGCRVRCKAAIATFERFADASSWLELGDCVELEDCVTRAKESK